jgi:hypothetical protein
VPPAFADETRAPVVAKKKLAPGETKTLNPQPIPPGRFAATTKASRNAGKQSIIFVGGKKAKTNKSEANTSAPLAKKSKAGTETPTRYADPPLVPCGVANFPPCGPK